MTETVINLESFVDDGPEDIVVDLPYLPLVEDALATMNVPVREGSKQVDRTLDLGLITIEDVKTSADLLVANGKTAPGRFPLRGAPTSNLDVVLIALRQHFRNSTDGWCPEIGKNRTMHGVHGAPHIGGSGYPAATNNSPVLAKGTGDKVRVGLIDTKLYPSEQFTGRVITLGDSLFARDFPFTQLSGHATFTTGLILEAAPGAVVIAKGVLHDRFATASVWDVATAMAQFVDQNVSVLVLPLVCFTDDGEAPLALQRAVNVLRNKVVVVAAAGNHGDAKPENGRDVNRLPAFPAACDGAIAVGAVGNAGDGFVRAEFSPDVLWVQVVAPGDEVTSLFVEGHVTYKKAGDLPLPTDPGEFHGGATWSGTSFAAATFGGLIANAVAEGQGTAFEVADRMLADKPHEHAGVGAYGLLER
ncbi:S8 family peptidase [Actinophytocola sp. KF-1]